VARDRLEPPPHKGGSFAAISGRHEKDSRAATVCILNSFGSSSAWRTALMQTFRTLCKRPKDARF